MSNFALLIAGVKAKTVCFGWSVRQMPLVLRVYLLRDKTTRTLSPLICKDQELSFKEKGKIEVTLGLRVPKSRIWGIGVTVWRSTPFSQISTE